MLLFLSRGLAFIDSLASFIATVEFSCCCIPV